MSEQLTVLKRGVPRSLNMTDFELLSIVTACTALVVSLVVWHGQRKLQKEANDLQRATAELSRRQLATIEKDEAAAKFANLSLALEQRGKEHVLAITNFGPAIARDVRVTPLGQGIEDSLLMQDELDAKFPMPRLLPHQRVGLMAHVYLGSPSKFLMRVEWQDETGQRSEVISVAL